MLRKQRPPKHILFIAEKSETANYITDVIKKSVFNPKDKVPKFTFSSEEPNFEQDLRPELLKKTDGAIFIVDSTNMDNLSSIKEFLWEVFVWNQESANIPILILSYNAEKDIALTAAEIIEAYSLIRLTDRLWNVMEIRENKSEDILACFQWLDNYIEVLGVKPKILKKKIVPTQIKKSNDKR